MRERKGDKERQRKREKEKDIVTERSKDENVKWRKTKVLNCG